MRPRAGNTRPYSIPEPLMHSVEADDSAARLFMEDSPLPAGGASPSPTVSSKGPLYLVGTKHSARGENNDGRPSVPPLRICLWLPHLIVGAHIMRLQAGNTRPYGIPETLVYSVGADDSAARTFTEISRHRRADEDIRPYGKYGCPVHFTGASTSAARLFMEDSLLPAVGASPSPAVSSKGPHIPQRPSTAVHRAAALFISPPEKHVFS